MTELLHDRFRAQAATLAHSLGLWERAAGVTHGGAGLERGAGRNGKGLPGGARDVLVGPGHDRQPVGVGAERHDLVLEAGP